MKEAIPIQTGTVSVEAYIELEERSEIRHEFINGNLIPMPGATDFHNDICFNIKALLKQLLQGRDAWIYIENVKVQITDQQDYTYPDVFVTLDARDTNDRYIKRYPIAIFEVISKSSRIEDSADKFIRYKNIESLRDYILVDSEKVFVELRSKQENGTWEATTYFLSDERFPLPSLNIELPLFDIYEGVEVP